MVGKRPKRHQRDARGRPKELPVLSSGRARGKENIEGIHDSRATARIRRLSPAPGRPSFAVVDMEQVKDTARALVRIGFDGRVHKTFRGHMAKERFENEVRVLRHLAEQGCDYVPKLIEYVPAELKIVTSNCGQRVDHLNPERMKEIYDSLLAYGVRHQDANLRNITYDRREGRFCVIDFEFAQLLHAPHLSPPPPPPDAPRAPGY